MDRGKRGTFQHAIENPAHRLLPFDETNVKYNRGFLLKHFFLYFLFCSFKFLYSHRQKYDCRGNCRNNPMAAAQKS